MAEWEIKQFIDLEWFEKIKTMAEYFVSSNALPKGIDNAWKLVMVLQAWKDLWLTVTQSMAGIALINGVVTVFGNIGALIMKRAWYDWKVIESTSKVCKIKIWKWESEEKATKIDEVMYDYEEAKFAWIIKWPWLQYPQEMIYWKCIARARKRVCPEVMDWYAIYEDYQEIEKVVVDEVKVMENFSKVEVVDESQTKLNFVLSEIYSQKSLSDLWNFEADLLEEWRVMPEVKEAFLKQEEILKIRQEEWEELDDDWIPVREKIEKSMGATKKKESLSSKKSKDV